VSYIGIRADERRGGYISHKPNIKALYPFIEDGIVKADVIRILEESVGIPEYYRWRSRSGCYFCFFQRQDEWIGLAENHPDLFERAKEYEKTDPISGRSFTWVHGMKLDELLQRKDQIKATVSKPSTTSATWRDQVKMNDMDDPTACLICTL